MAPGQHANRQADGRHDGERVNPFDRGTQKGGRNRQLRDCYYAHLLSGMPHTSGCSMWLTRADVSLLLISAGHIRAPLPARPAVSSQWRFPWMRGARRYGLASVRVSLIRAKSDEHISGIRALCRPVVVILGGNRQGSRSAPNHVPRLSLTCRNPSSSPIPPRNHGRFARA